MSSLRRGRRVRIAPNCYKRLKNSTDNTLLGERRWRNSRGLAEVPSALLSGSHLKSVLTLFNIATQAKRQRVKSPYTLSVSQQIQLCVKRGYQRTRGDMSLFLTGLLGQVIMALIIGSVFYNLPNETGSLYSRGALLFFAILMAAFQSSLEVSFQQF